MTFIRKKENFTCSVCGTQNRGDGYTNHCVACLVSRHVDHDPGDRAHTCQGLMHPIMLEGEGRARKIVHECERCGVRKRVRIGKGDSEKALRSITTYQLYGKPEAQEELL